MDILKIAFFVTEFPCLSETFIVNQIIQLQNSGHLVHIYARQKNKTSKVQEVITDVGLLQHTFFLDEYPKSRANKIGHLIFKSFGNIHNKNVQVIFKALIKNKSVLSIYDIIPFIEKPFYNVVHAHFGVNGVYVAQLRLLGLFQKAKFLTTFHGYDLVIPKSQKNYYSHLFENCDLFTVNSNYSKNLLTCLGCEEKKIHLLPVGLDINKFKSTSKVYNQHKKVNILFIGRLIKLKGPDVFVEVCNVLNKKGVVSFSAVIIGEGEMYKEVENLILKYKLQKNVTMLGAKQQDEIIGHLDSADIFILPGININGLAETQGLVIQEAQAMELPVLVSDVGGMKEGIIDGSTGFVLPESDIERFSDKIEFLANNFKLRKVMGLAGRKLAEDKYDIKILNIRLLKLYMNKTDIAS